MVVNGFKNIVLMGEHGGGQKELAEVAKKTNAKYGPQGVHVFFRGDFYEKTQNEFQQWVIANHLPPSSHGGIPDTSLMMYRGPMRGCARTRWWPAIRCCCRAHRGTRTRRG
jgi:creatinine amidohydrolase